jgi:hypothetical protein
MAGYIHIFRNEVATGTYGSSATEYQLTYTSGRNSWAGTFDEAGLEEFLANDVGLTEENAAEAVVRARLQGNVTITDVEISEHEAGPRGLHQMPSDI